MVVRIAGLAYQKGFGGHFHNDNAIAVLRDIPGLVVAVPARPDDAPPLLRTLLAAAESDGQVSVLLEPIALYHQRDLHRAGDRGWLGEYPPPDDADAHIPIGSARVYGDGMDLTILTFGNGLRMSLRVAGRLKEYGIARPGRRSTVRRAPADRGHRARVGGHRASTGSRRDPAFGRRRRGRRHRSRRSRLRRPDHPGIQRGQLHPARGCGDHRVAGRSRHRPRGPEPHHEETSTR